jgi:hypothetical protein
VIAFESQEKNSRVMGFLKSFLQWHFTFFILVLTETENEKRDLRISEYLGTNLWFQEQHRHRLIKALIGEEVLMLPSKSTVKSHH